MKGDTMIFAYILAIALFIGSVKGIFDGIKKKDYLAVAGFVFILPFWFFMLSSFVLGGSVSHNAAENYEFYEQGKYYLQNHSHYLEVTKQQYDYMKIVEMIGIPSFCVAFILFGIANLKNRKEKAKNPDLDVKL